MLFFKECKKIICSLTFLLYVVVIALMYGTQYGSALQAPKELPQPGQEWYGTKYEETEEIIVPAAVEQLINEYMKGDYKAYPFGLYKQVKLKEKDSARVAAIIEELTDLTRQEMDSFEDYAMGGYFASVDENGKESIVYRPPVLPEYELKDVSYEHFKELMEQADEIIGGGSDYEVDTLISNFSGVPMTYEDAVKSYEILMADNNLTEGYLRLFCDYFGIDLAILPVFVCVSLWQQDKKNRMEALIQSREISSVKLLLTRYLALLACMMIPVLAMGLHAVSSIRGLYPELNLFFGSAIGMSALWLIPELMVVIALGALLTEVVSPLIAIFVQGAWWYMALEMKALTGDITKYALILRHNSLGDAALFQSQYDSCVWNRCFYFIVSVVLFAVTAFCYERKRKGK